MVCQGASASGGSGSVAAAVRMSAACSTWRCHAGSLHNLRNNPIQVTAARWPKYDAETVTEHRIQWCQGDSTSDSEGCPVSAQPGGVATGSLHDVDDPPHARTGSAADEILTEQNPMYAHCGIAAVTRSPSKAQPGAGAGSGASSVPAHCGDCSTTRRMQQSTGSPGGKSSATEACASGTWNSVRLAAETVWPSALQKLKDPDQGFAGYMAVREHRPLREAIVLPSPLGRTANRDPAVHNTKTASASGKT
jgi:hypothetical protein